MKEEAQQTLEKAQNELASAQIAEPLEKTTFAKSVEPELIKKKIIAILFPIFFYLLLFSFFFLLLFAKMIKMRTKMATKSKKRSSAFL